LLEFLVWDYGHRWAIIPVANLGYFLEERSCLLVYYDIYILTYMYIYIYQTYIYVCIIYIMHIYIYYAYIYIYMCVFDIYYVYIYIL
jgi:hypothetical protein